MPQSQPYENPDQERYFTKNTTQLSQNPSLDLSRSSSERQLNENNYKSTSTLNNTKNNHEFVEYIANQKDF